MRPLLPVRLGPPCRRPILNATTSPLYARRYTSSKIRIADLSQETFDLHVRFEGADSMLDKTLVEKVQARRLFFYLAQDSLSPREADRGLAIFARDDLHDSSDRGFYG